MDQPTVRPDNARTSRMPSSTSLSLGSGSLPTRSLKKDLSSVTIWETFTTDSRPNFTLRLERDTLPGAAASFIFEVIAATTTVLMRLRLKSSDCKMTTGRLNPGSDAAGSGESAHHTSPRFIYQSSFASTLSCMFFRLGSMFESFEAYTSSSFAVMSSVR